MCGRRHPVLAELVDGRQGASLAVRFPRGQAGKVVRCSKHLDVSARLRQRASKRVRVVQGNRPA